MLPWMLCKIFAASTPISTYSSTKYGLAIFSLNIWSISVLRITGELACSDCLHSCLLLTSQCYFNEEIYETVCAGSYKWSFQEKLKCGLMWQRLVPPNIFRPDFDVHLHDKMSSASQRIRQVAMRSDSLRKKSTSVYSCIKIFVNYCFGNDYFPIRSNINYPKEMQNYW